MAVSKKSVPGTGCHFDVDSLVTPSLQTSKSRTLTFWTHPYIIMGAYNEGNDHNGFVMRTQGMKALHSLIDCFDERAKPRIQDGEKAPFALRRAFRMERSTLIPWHHVVTS